MRVKYCKLHTILEIIWDSTSKFAAMGSNLSETYFIWGLFYRRKNSNIVYKILFHVSGTSCIHPLTMALLLDSLWSVCTIHFNAICKCTNENKNVTDRCGSWLRRIMRCISNGCLLASIKDKFIIVQYQSVSPSPMFFNKKFFIIPLLIWRYLPLIQGKLKFLTFQAFLQTVQVMSISFFHYFINEELNLFFSPGYVHKFCLFYDYNFCILVDHLRIIITSLFKPELSSKTRRSVG